MKKEKIPEKLIEETLEEFNEIKNEICERNYREWLANLHFQLLDPNKIELIANDIYDKYGDWIERELVNLENETNLSWEEQSVNIANVHIKVKKHTNSAKTKDIRSCFAYVGSDQLTGAIV